MKRNIRYKPSKINSGMTFVVGILFVIIGIAVVLPATIASGFVPAVLFGLVWTGGAVAITVMHGLNLFGKTTKTDLFGGFEVTDDTPQRPVSFRPDAPDHMHITGASLSPKERLEQLEVLKGAGLIDDGEYQEKRKEILREL